VRLTFATAYAIRALVHLSAGKGDRLTTSHVVAAAEGLPKRFLLKILKSLVSARILLGVKGPNGGYRLARPADRITLLQVIEAVEGPLLPIVPEVARGKVDEHLKDVCGRTAEVVRQQLRKVTVLDLARKGK
jgi:Rrf2 family protein